MSAFIVTKTHVDAIVTYAVRRRETLYGKTKHYDLSDIENRDRLGQLLTDANYASVNCRYQENDRAPEYKFTAVKPISTLQMLKALRCLDYQSCEIDEWRDTEAYAVIVSLTNRAINDLPGYGDAEWGIRD